MKLATEGITIDKDFKRALKAFLETDSHVLVTGRAGTGKSTLLNYYLSITEKQGAVVAPTGVAAVNVGGETIHSFFKFHPGITVEEAQKNALRRKDKEIYEKLEELIIDEISMVRADLLDCVEAFLRTIRRQKRPFGGVRLIMFGDLYQLPPVVTNEEKKEIEARYDSPFFFSSFAYQALESQLTDRVERVELQQIYRQTEVDFIGILNKIRDGSVEEEDLRRLNGRLFDAFEDSEGYIVLTATNYQADEINNQQLKMLETEERVYKAGFSGDFPKAQMPTQEHLVLKTGARVMLLNNDQQKRWVNGTVGTVAKTEEGFIEVEIDPSAGSGQVMRVRVEPFSWTAYKSEYDAKNDRIEKREVGSFIQLPVRLAWAVTIHKAQGKTFEKVIVDMGRGAFAHGQTYVALSRCKSLEGLRLVKPIGRGHVIMDRRVVEFLKN